ncbi:MAG: hypothetical protein AB1705_10375, partial [Verrucomicrobiota bacterium]
MGSKQSGNARGRAEDVVASLAGLFVVLAVVKLGNPVVLEHRVEPPRDVFALLIQPWPLTWGFWLLGALTLVAVSWRMGLRGNPKLETRNPKQGAAAPPVSKVAWVARVIPWLPLAWLAWQGLSATQTVDPGLTRVTLPHFVACTVCFYLGWWALSRLQSPRGWWVGIVGALFIVLAIGWHQKFIQLEATKRFLLENEETAWSKIEPADREELVRSGVLIMGDDGRYHVHPHVIAKLEKGRISSTLVYPNALAGALLLLVPVGLAVAWLLSEGASPGLRWGLVGLVGAAAAACLYWSGSKSGWLIALGLAGVFALRGGLPFGRAGRYAMLGVLLLGLAAFGWKYADYFRKGASSLGARADYWRTALRTA